MAQRAVEFNDMNAEARAHHAINKNLELTARLLGDLDTGHKTVVNQLLVAPEYLALRHGLLQALRPYPDAARAVAAVLQEIEAPETPMIEMNGGDHAGT